MGEYSRPRPRRPPRPLDWDMLALKLAIMDPAIYAEFGRFGDDPYEDRPNWVTDFAEAQKRLGIYPLNGAEGDCMRVAVKKMQSIGKGF